MSEFARPFKVYGVPGILVLHGVQFPSGRCVLDDEQNGLIHGAVSFDTIALEPGVVVEWADGCDQP